MKLFLIGLTLIMTLNVAEAAVEVKQFKNPQQEQRYKKIINELRCLVCQNQNLAGSDAGLAQDLRKQVYNMIQEGKSDEAIMEFMVSRYGDFVLYRPPFKTITLLLWLGPFIILIAGLFILIRFIRQRQHVVIKNITDNEKEKLKQLLDENKEQDK